MSCLGGISFVLSAKQDRPNISKSWEEERAEANWKINEIKEWIGAIRLGKFFCVEGKWFSILATVFSIYIKHIF